MNFLVHKTEWMKKKDIPLDYLRMSLQNLKFYPPRRRIEIDGLPVIAIRSDIYFVCLKDEGDTATTAVYMVGYKNGPQVVNKLLRKLDEFFVRFCDRY